MKTILFNGTSDDLLQYQVIGKNGEEVKSGESGGYQKQITFKVYDQVAKNGLYIIGHYSTCGTYCWMLGVETIDPVNPVDWKVILEPSIGYGNGLTLSNVPDEVVIEKYTTSNVLDELVLS